MNYDAVVVAGGKGERANLGYNKAFYVMNNGKTVLENACSCFINDDDCKKIIVVCNEPEKVFKNNKIEIVQGGEKRSNSVYNGLCKCESEYVMIHDAARPYLNNDDVKKIKEALLTSDGVILATKAIDTVKFVENGVIKNTINRDNVYLALTPQSFKTALIKDAYGTLDVSDCTDDASVFEKYNHVVKVVEGSSDNIKLTYKEDFNK